MFSIDVFSRVPVYEQIIKQAEDYVSNGLLRSGDKIPSVRNLSVSLSVNPNTIQKAYSDLDARGIIYSVPGIGCFVAKNATDVLKVHMRRKLDAVRQLAEDLALAGSPEEDLIETIHSAYEERGVMS